VFIDPFSPPAVQSQTLTLLLQRVANVFLYLAGCGVGQYLHWLPDLRAGARGESGRGAYMILCVNPKPSWLRCVQLLVSGYMCHVANDTGNTATLVAQVLLIILETRNTQHEHSKNRCYAHRGTRNYSMYFELALHTPLLTIHRSSHVTHAENTQKTLTDSTMIQDRKIIMNKEYPQVVSLLRDSIR
jgi:hypothetical protein